MSETLLNTADGVKIEVLMMKTVSAALLMWLVSILVPLRRCGAVSAKGTASADVVGQQFARLMAASHAHIMPVPLKYTLLWRRGHGLVWNQMSDLECLSGRDLMQC